MNILNIFNRHKHRVVSNKRGKEIKHLILLYGLDAIGSSAFGNMDSMKKLRQEYNACTKCGKQVRKGRFN